MSVRKTTSRCRVEVELYHRFDERLVAVAQIDRAPDRRLLDGAGRPLAIGQDDPLIGAVFGDVHGGHDEPWKLCGGLGVGAGRD
jgi:hypothetical protein